MAWTRLVSGSTAGNVSLNIDVNVTSVERTSNTNVKVKYGVRFSMATNTYTYNSIAAFIPAGGTRRYAFVGSSSTHISSGTYYYANTTGNTTTSAVTPFTQNITVTQTQTSASFKIGFGWDAWTPSEKGTATISVTFPTEATKPTGVSCSVSSKTETTVTLSGSYSSDGGASVSTTGYQYSTDNSTWKTFSNGNTTLSANTKYYFRYYATNSQGTAYSSSVNTTTYDYPYCTSTPDFTIGDIAVVKFYNPLGRTFTFEFIANNVSIFTEEYSGTSRNSFDSANTIRKLYATIPDKKEATYKIVVTYGNSVKTRDNGNKYKIKGTEVPTFLETDIINVIDTKHVNDITGLGTKIIKGHNTITGTIKPMVANNSAEGKRYIVSANANPSSQEITHTGSNKTFTFENITVNSFTVTAYDTRELSTARNKSIDLVEYTIPKVNNLTINRQNGIGEYAILSADGTFTHWSGWEEIKKYNSIQKVWIRYKKATDSSYAMSWIQITEGLIENTNGRWRVQIALDDIFNTIDKYDFQLTVEDLLEESKISSNTLSTANSFLWRDLKNKRLGINKKPEEALDVQGNIKTDGDYILPNGYTIQNHLDTNLHQLQWATILPDGIDLNDITQTGTYRSRGTTQTATMKNVPAGQTSGFQLLVFRNASMNYYDDSIPECLTQEIRRDSRIFTRHTWNYGEDWSDWAVHCGYRIGDIYITSTPDNPSYDLGGTWELIDKEFESYQNKYTDAADIAKYITCTSNCDITEFVVRRIGHTIVFRIYFVINVDLADSTVSLADLNFSALGIKGLSYQQTNILMGGDGGNGIAITNVSDGGNINVVDVIPKGSNTTLASGYTPRLYYQQTLPSGNMLESACDKFYWKRIA